MNSLVRFFAKGVMVVVAAFHNLNAQVLFDNFDSYANQAAFDAVWATSATPMTLVNTQSWSSPNSIYQGTGAQQSRLAIGYDIPVSMLDFKFRFYDPAGAGSLARTYGMVYAYAGGVWGGTLQQIVAIGKWNAIADAGDPTYHARVAFGSLNWFKLDDPLAPRRSVGWHEARVVGSLISPTTAQYEFYIDGILSKTVTSTVTSPFNWIVMGSNLTSTHGMWYDDVQIVIPEPSVAALGLMGGVAL
ncbi:MAG: hypothetical protein RMK20_10620, partial [Verrucomicrobiales bacterium]|nr:hypothetical protein [Verrucomicrobiales bacterium]